MIREVSNSTKAVQVARQSTEAETSHHPFYKESLKLRPASGIHDDFSGFPNMHHHWTMPTRNLDHIDGAAVDQFEVVDHLLLMDRSDNVVICTHEVGNRNIAMTCAGHLLVE